jgi:hypothetical protein
MLNKTSPTIVANVLVRKFFIFNYFTILFRNFWLNGFDHHYSINFNYIIFFDLSKEYLDICMI